jgi:hypothetical protein
VLAPLREKHEARRTRANDKDEDEDFVGVDVDTLVMSESDADPASGTSVSLDGTYSVDCSLTKLELSLTDSKLLAGLADRILFVE